jgi:hypothetical protein
MKIYIMKTKFQLLGLIAFVAVTLFPACQPAGQAEAEAEAAQEEAITQLVDNVVNMWNTLSADRIGECYASSFQRETPTGAQTSHAELSELLTQVGNMYSNFRVTMHEVTVKGDQAFGNFSISGENTGPMGENMPATGGSFNVEGAVTIKVVDGKIVEEKAFWNQLQLMTQLGYSLQEDM